MDAVEALRKVLDHTDRVYRCPQRNPPPGFTILNRGRTDESRRIGDAVRRMISEAENAAG